MSSSTRVVAREAAPIAVQPVVPAPVAASPCRLVASRRACLHPAPPVAVAPVAAAPRRLASCPSADGRHQRPMPDAETLRRPRLRAGSRRYRARVADLDFVGPTVVARGDRAAEAAACAGTRGYQPAVRQPEGASRARHPRRTSHPLPRRLSGPVYQRAPPISRRPPTVRPSRQLRGGVLPGAGATLPALTEELPFSIRR